MFTINNYSFYYIESNLFCIVILLVLIWSASRASDRSMSQRMFRNVIFVEIFYFLTDILWVLVDAGSLTKTVGTIYLTNIVNYIASVLMGFTLFVYMELFQNSGWLNGRQSALKLAVPAILDILMIITTPWTHLAFHVEEKAGFVAGPLYFLMLGVSFGYLIVAAVHAFRLYQKPENYATRDIHLTIAVFPIAPLFCAVLQALNWRVPWICYGVTLAMILMYVNFAENKISTDPLTRLNNRNELNRYISQAVANAETRNDMYLMVIDADYFKEINDTYGHLEGDRALVTIADTLKKVCRDRSGHEFIARFGGDEFIIISHYPDEEKEKELERRIIKAEKEAGEALGKPYKISVTTGYAGFGSDARTSTIPGLFEAADAMLYERKKARITA